MLTPVNCEFALPKIFFLKTMQMITWVFVAYAFEDIYREWVIDHAQSRDQIPFIPDSFTAPAQALACKTQAKLLALPDMIIT